MQQPELSAGPIGEPENTSKKHRIRNFQIGTVILLAIVVCIITGILRGWPYALIAIIDELCVMVIFVSVRGIRRITNITFRKARFVKRVTKRVYIIAIVTSIILLANDIYVLIMTRFAFPGWTILFTFALPAIIWAGCTLYLLGIWLENLN